MGEEDRMGPVLVSFSWTCSLPRGRAVFNSEEELLNSSERAGC